MNIKKIILFNLLSFCVVYCDNDENTRNLKVESNPGCADQINQTLCENYILVHVTADSNTGGNTLHYLFDLIGKPSVLIAKTPVNTSLNINWTQISDNSNCVKFSNDPEYVVSTVIDKIVLFNDTDGTSNYSDPNNTVAIKFDPLAIKWDLVNLTESNGKKVMLEVNATNINNGSFSLRFTAFGFQDHNEDLPKLLHTSDSMQIDIIASKIHSNYSSPRIAMELLMVSSENKSEGAYKMNRIRNLDDEFTPGIFDVYNLLSPRSDNDTKGAFVQFRPVCYTSHYRSVSYSTESRHGEVQNAESDDFKYSLPSNFFDSAALDHALKQAINITFGMPDDGFYSHTNYISFSFLFGLGSPASEGLSMFVKIFSAVGLGVPLLVLIVGGIYVAVKRYRN
ncbi:glycosylated lysosomal membrane protein B-like [Chironomus tepperi]|uniref:glycosylated lysosomal membrane protein B-like n=1 Tax=Chironomus tepperi TaxID=113505 RepID=UPI00391F3C76